MRYEPNLDVMQNSAQDAFQLITRPHQLCWGDWEMGTAIRLSGRKRAVCQLQFREVLSASCQLQSREVLRKEKELSQLHQGPLK